MNPTFSDLVLGSELKSLLTQPSQHIVFAIKDTKKSYQPYDQTPSLTSSQATPALKEEIIRSGFDSGVPIPVVSAHRNVDNFSYRS